MKARSGGALMAAAALLTLAACGSPGAASGTAAGAASAAVSALPAQAASGGQGGQIADGLGHPVSVCALMPAATVARITSEPITVAKEADTLSYKIYSCDYDNAAGTVGLSISVLAKDAVAGYSAAVQAAGSGGHPVSGLGDKAFSSILGLEALYGNVSITVANLPSDTAGAALIRMLQPKL
jgi:glucose/arabinose dehydrogenase